MNHLNDISCEITPHLGIGDLIIIKMIEITNKLNIKIININADIVKKYSSDPPKKFEFIKHFINLLFPIAESYINNKTPDFTQFCNKYPLSHVYLFDHLNKSLFKSIENPYTNYIVFKKI